MTLDLDDLERKAKAALEETDDRAPHDWDALSPKADKTATLHSELTPAVVLALIERVRELERTYVAPSEWRCDGCGDVARPDDGRRPDRHESCGGQWIRQVRDA